MPKSKASAAVPSVAEAANKSWRVFAYYNPGSARDPQLSYVSGYRRCAADMLSDLFEFGGWDVLTRRMLEVLEDLAVQRDAVRSVMEEVASD